MVILPLTKVLPWIRKTCTIYYRNGQYPRCNPLPKGTENNGVLIKGGLNLKKPKMLLE